jgi:RHH-type rel operon transcriptional repressor/antitoxin RelB
MGSLGPNGGEIAAAGLAVDATARLDEPRLPRYSTATIPETMMLTVRLPVEIEKRLNSLAKKTGRSKSFYAREAILRHLDDLEDSQLALRRFARKTKRVTLEQLEREIAEGRHD